MNVDPYSYTENPNHTQPDPFPEPSTIPAGWDCSGLIDGYVYQAPAPCSSQESQTVAESERMVKFS